MANEKVYVGEEGAKELYRKIKALIPGAVTVVDEVSINSMDAVTSHAVAVAVGNLTGFQKVNGTGNDKHPDVAEPNTRTIYLVKIPEIVGDDKYKEWIWVIPEQGEGSWECIGSTSIADNSWKQWSEDHGSTSSNDNSDKSIYIGSNNTINAHSAVAIGKLNTISNSRGHGTHIYGNNNTVSDGHDSIVVGHNNTSSASLQVEIFGQKNSVDQTKTGTQNSAILGFNNTANDFDRSVMLGIAAKSTEALYSTVIGNGAELYNCTYGTVVGGANIVKNGSYNSVFGSGNQVNVENSGGYKVSTIGNNLTISGTETHVMGSHSTVTGYRNHAIVTNSTINANNSNVIGSQISIYADSSGNVGYNNYVFGAMDGVYGGSQNVIVGCTSSIKDKRSNTVIVGENSTVENISDELTNYSNTNIISIGYSNNAKSAANAYQIGQNNSVTGNNLDLISNYPHQTAVNLGVYNTITKEGVNIGKDNSAEAFGINLGSDNISRNGSISIGKYANSEYGSIAIGKGSTSTVNGVNVVNWVYATGNSVAFGIGKINTTLSGFAIGYENAEITGHSFGIGLFSRDSVSPTTISGGSVGFITDSIGEGTPYGISHITGGSVGFGSGLNVSGGSCCVGRSINADGNSLVFGLGCDAKTGSLVCGSSSYVIENGSQVFGSKNSLITNGSIVCGINNNTVGFEWTDSKDEKHSGGGNCVLGTSNNTITGGVSVVGQYNSHIYDGAAVVGYNNHNIHTSGWVFGDAITNVYYDGVGIGDEIASVDTAGVAIGFNLYNINTNGIAIGCRNASVVNSSIAIGTDNNTIWYGSIALGLRNHGYRGALMMGIDNNAYISQYSAKFHTNSVILGFQNKVCNVREQFKCELDDSDHLRYELACGFVAGSTNCIYGHNPIVIGVHNTVGDETNWYNDDTQASDPTSETDNDGFMTAIGYKCEALRNYDMAIGYMSKAKGGENIAINASSAIGFTNIAINHSEIKGVGNIGILESKLVTPIENIYKRGEYYDDEAYNVHNLLFHSNLYHTTDEIYGPGDTEHSPNYEAFQLIDNICIHSNSALIGGSGALFNGNLFAMDDGLTISSPNASNNIIWKMHIANNYHLYGDNIVATGDVCRNMSIGSELSINGIQYYTNNVSLGESKIRLQGMTGAVKMDSNFLFKGNITGSDFGAPNREYAINNNVVMSTSLLELSNDNTIDSCTFNMVLNGSGLRTENTKAYWNGGTNQCSKSNVLFGTYGFGLLGCFSHSDTVSALSSTTVQLIDSYSATFDRMLFDMNVGAPVSGAPDVANAFLRNARLATNFGDNALKNINTALVTGESNWVLGVRSAVVHGNKNAVINTDETIHPMNAMPYVTVIGNDNRIKNSGHGSYFNHNWVEGNYNWVYGSKIADTRIHGTRNIISSLDEQNIPVLTPDEVMALQTQYKTDASGLSCGVFIAAQDGYVYKYNTSGTETTTSIYAGNAYQFTKVLNVAYQQVGLNCDYLNNLAYGSLGYKKLYAPSTFDNAHDVYRITIFGEENSVNSRVAGYSIFGSCNTLRNTLFPNNSEFCIGNGFIQGNDNTVQDGSNIISMGNGNTSIGHNSVAIGSQLKSNQWQTVIGKYNKEVAGPSRIMSSFNPSEVYSSGDVVFYATNNAYYEYTAPQSSSGVWDPSKWTETHPEEDKALFIIGNGYSETDGRNWLDESKIHRSNAMEVYADGTVKARRFISDEPDLELTEGTGIQISKNVTAGTVTVSVTHPLPTAPSVPGTYALQCVVDASGNPTYSWVAIGTANV